jgi:hypothetical protein
MGKSKQSNSQNESELLFEQYLKTHQYEDFNHESPIEGKRKKA